MNCPTFIATFIAAIIATLTLAQPPAAHARSADTPETGRVQWGRDLEKAFAASKSSGKPVFLLFQEIPGCQVCKDFGTQPLSHPLLAEAIENEFVPVLIHNNKPGRDAAILKRFNEPASNFPVMRFLDPAGKDIVAREEEIFSVHDVALRMIEALRAAKRDVPRYLQLAANESETNRRYLENATFAMHCFWEGEAKIGGIEGVIATRTAHLNGDEVVDLIFDTRQIKFTDLVRKAVDLDCASTVYAHSDVQIADGRAIFGELIKPAREKIKVAPESDQLYYLAKSPLRYLPLTPMQAMKVNAALHAEQDVTVFLSPHQRELATKISAMVEKNDNALHGLERPHSAEELATYQDKLEARLRLQH